MNQTFQLDDLVAMSRELGRPELDYVILGEGNTSIRRDEDSFWIKASGHGLRTAGHEGFVAIETRPVLELIDREFAATGELQAAIAACRCDAGGARPSIEVMLHALALTLGQAQAVGHTHPTPLVALLCAAGSREVLAGRLFPDEVVVCGSRSVYVPYAAPGLALARATREALLRYREQHAEPPRVVLLENHGLLALGQSPAEVLRVTAMCVKAARILHGTLALGGPRFLSQAEIGEIAGREDEHFRRRVLEDAR